MRGLLEPDSPIDGSARCLEFIGYLGVTEIRMGKVHRRQNARGNVPTSVSPAYLQKKTTRFIERIAGLFIGYWVKTRNADLTVENPIP